MNSSLFQSRSLQIAVGVVVSVVLSLWAVIIDPVINNDGVYYILTAELIAAGRWGDALLAFKWPAYSLLVFLVEQLPGVDFHNAARIVTTVGYTVAVLGFVALARLLGGGHRIAWLALLTILAYPGFNEFRSYLIRDSVFLAFYLFGLLYLLKFAQNRNTGALVGSFCLFGCAALFRVEAAMFLALFPLILISEKGFRGWRLLVSVIYVVVALEVLGTFYGWWLMKPEGQLDAWSILRQPGDLLMAAFQQIGADFSSRLDRIDAAMPDTVPSFMAWPVALLLVLGIVARESIEALTVPYALILIVAVIGFRPLFSAPADTLRILKLVVALQAMVLVIFVAARFFLAPRYPIALTVTLALAVPFAVDRILSILELTGRTRQHRVALGLLALMFLVNAIEGLDAFTRKHHIRAAGDWMQKNIPEDSRVVSNDLKLLFYADHYRGDWGFIKDSAEFAQFLIDGNWRTKDYVAVYLRRRDETLKTILIRTLAQKPVREFVGESGDKLLVFHTGDD